MSRETEFFVFLLLNDLNKCIEAHVEKQRAEAVIIIIIFFLKLHFDI